MEVDVPIELYHEVEARGILERRTPSQVVARAIAMYLTAMALAEEEGWTLNPIDGGAA